jgi:hypothetical protein
MPEEKVPQAPQSEDENLELPRKKPDQKLHHPEVEEVAQKMHEATEKPHDGPLEG